MPASIWRTGTRYVANELTITRGSVDDILEVGVYHNVDPSVVPTPADFETVPLVKPPNPLADGDKIDVLSLIGPRAGADLALTAGAYQRWVYVKTASEDIIERVDLLTVL